MRNIKCSDCAEYRNEWCEKVIDSPHPDILRDCQYFHDKDRDVIKVIRCKDCKFYTSMRSDLKTGICALLSAHFGDDGFCSEAERRQDE